MTKEELRFHIGGVLVCPELYKKGDLKDTMNFEQTIKDIMSYVDLYIKLKYES